MGQRKKIAQIANAVTGILGDEIKGKQIKKGKALKRFIKKMEMRRRAIKDDLDRGGLKKGREKLLRDHLETLGKQIKKAEKILDTTNA